MRLINVHTRFLREFYDADVPPYAILSHTWGDDEVSYEDMISGQARDKDAYRKIGFLCTQALADALDWAWMDTCCINKASSAELSEAINSMFRWYRRARCCYAFLSDVPAQLFWQDEYKHMTGPYELSECLARSRWFRRGWCLQELIAPRTARFYGKVWNYLGDRDDLAPLIAKITGIRERVLQDPQNEVSRCTVAEKMSWAASRKTSRVEDTAYSLLGIFDVSMPMLYGEGKRAFQRLQEEIIKATDDHSIFVWQPDDADEYHLLLAPEPSRFAHGAFIVTIPALHRVDGHTLGNTGLRISLPLTPVLDRPGCYHAMLGCRYRDDYQNVIALCLQRRTDVDLMNEQNTLPTASSTAALDDQSKRKSQRLDNVAKEKLPSALFVAPTVARSQRCVVERVPRQIADFPSWPSLMISRTLPVAEQQDTLAGAKYWFETEESTAFSIVAAYPPECFNSQTSVMNLGDQPTKYGAVLLSLSEGQARTFGLNESTWQSHSLAVVFGSWTSPDLPYDARNDSMGIFGVVQSDAKNLSNACRLAVSKSIYRSADASQHHVAWVRSTYLVPWGDGYYLDVSFKSDRRIGLLSEVVNIICMTIRSEHEIARTTRMPVYKQAEDFGGNPLSVERLQDVVRSWEEDELEGVRQSFESDRPGLVYELEDDSWRVQPPEPEDSGETIAESNSSITLTPFILFATKKINTISRDWRHKRSASGAKRAYYRKKRAFEKGRQPANTRIGAKRIHLVRTRGGNRKFRALRLDSGNFSWGSEGVARKVRVIAVAFHPSNNELVRTNTLTKSAVVQVDATPFRQWYEAHYGQSLGRRRQQKSGQAEEETKKSRSVEKKQSERFQKVGKVEPALERQFEAGRVYAVVASRPGQSGRCDGYILEGEELAFYQRAIKK